MLTVLACCPPTAHFSSCWQKVTRRRHKKEPADKDPIRQIIKGSDPMTYHAEIIAVGTVSRMPAREDIDMPIEEHLIVELYSK